MMHDVVIEDCLEDFLNQYALSAHGTLDSGNLNDISVNGIKKNGSGKFDTKLVENEPCDFKTKRSLN